MRFLADEDVDHGMIRALRRAAPNARIVTIRELGMRGMSDDGVLLLAAERRWLVITHDRGTMTNAFYARIRRGEPVTALFVVDKSARRGALLVDLRLIVNASEPEHWHGHVVYLPWK